jgi:hypothetical protein
MLQFHVQIHLSLKMGQVRTDKNAAPSFVIGCILPASGDNFQPIEAEQLGLEASPSTFIAS